MEVSRVLSGGAPGLTEGEVSSRYEVSKSIGQGAFGEALLGTRREDGLPVVLKRVRITDLSDKERDGAINEVKLLAQFNHANIIRYYECILEDGALNIVMEYADEGELSTVIQERAKKKLPYQEDQIMFMFVQILLALMHIHSHKVLHRDLKSQNIFLCKGGILKIGDFGISRVLNTAASMARTAIGTPYYMSPEMFDDQPYGAKSDIWALGCILCELATLKRAFDANHIGGLMAKIVSGRTPTLPTKYSSHLRDLVTSMLQQRPADRPSTAQILKKDYVRQYITRYARFMMEHSNEGDNPSGPLALGLENLPMPSAAPVSVPGPSDVDKSAASASKTKKPAARKLFGLGRPPSASSSKPPAASGSSEAPSLQPLADVPSASGSEPQRKPAASSAAKPNRQRWFGTGRRQQAEARADERAVQDLPDLPPLGGASGSRPSTAGSQSGIRPSSAAGGRAGPPRGSGSEGGGVDLAVQGSGVRGAGGVSASNRASVTQESFSQAAIAVTAHGHNPPENPAMPAIGITKRSPARGGGFLRPQGNHGSASHARSKATSSGARSSGQVNVEFTPDLDDMKRQQKVEAERERKRLMKLEKDKREREEAAKRRQERQAEKEAKAQEDAKKAKEKEQQKARAAEQEAKRKERAALLARQERESRKQIRKHKEVIKSARPTIDKASLKKQFGSEFAARQETLQRHESDSVLVVPTADSSDDGAGSHRRSTDGAASRQPSLSNCSTPTKRSPMVSKVAGAPSATPSPPRPPRRLWAKSSNKTGSPGVEIYVPANIRQVSVWDDEVAESRSDQQEVVDEQAAREEVTHGLEKLRDFNDNLKRIWDGRQGRDLLMVLDDIQGVLENECIDHGGPADDSPPSTPSDCSPKMEHITADRIEFLKANLEDELGVDRLNALCRHVLRSQEEEEEEEDGLGSGSARGGVQGILRPNEMHFMRQVTKLVLMEQKFYR